MRIIDFEIGIDQPFFLIAGPCVVESEKLAMDSASALKEITSDLGINFIYKSSYDKANRTSADSFRGLGISLSALALSIASFSDSTTQGPAIKKKGWSIPISKSTILM